ncbi:uncharacterized protein LOC130247488 [Danio aesculapii]|uniref:uncharacterized protein LOC130247488 n=1 Tax=Danio aesculapii TaxID=1142201 RepID=UPI0024C00B9F|nr:uncharacterized protein LOC130247488 [Danio aesculapii]
MDMTTSEEECLVCMEKICNPLPPSQPCCGKIICQRCLSHSFRYRSHCPHCRSQQHTPNYAAVRGPFSITRNILPVQPGNFQGVNSRHVDGNIQNLITQLRNSQTQQTDTVNQVNPPNQASPQNQAPPLLNHRPRPIPRPRFRFSRRNASPSAFIPVAPSTAPSTLLLNPAPQPTSVTAPNGPFQIAPTPAPAPAQAPRMFNPAPQPMSVTAAPGGLFQNTPRPAPAPLLQNIALFQDSLLEQLDDWPWQTEIALMGLIQEPLSVPLRTFVCPYCQYNGFDELQLLNHCNIHHASDSRRVVCPVCVATPHGDPQYYSRNFIGHLNQRHRFYLDDITPLQQSDEVNLQHAIMASYQQH